VQRVPVRIELDREQLAQHPLRVGLSMQATVDLAADASQDADGVATARAAPNDGMPALRSTPTLVPASAAVSARSAEPATDTAPADEMVRDIIAANQGPARRR
ncbi:MAG: hypothetical protein ABIR94_22440, partial [Rubrivivax sp.]